MSFYVYSLNAVTFDSILFAGKCVLWGLIALVLATGCQTPTTERSPENALLDVRTHDLRREKIGIVGDYHFVWGAWVSPTDIRRADAFAYVPALWTSYQAKGIPTEAYGKATYAVRLLLPDIGEPLGLETPEMPTASRIFLNDSLVATIGEPGTDASSTLPRTQRGIYTIPQHLLADTLQITFQIANFRVNSGGFWQSPSVSSLALLQTQWEYSIYADFFLLGSIFIIGLYHIGLYYVRKNRKQERSVLFLALFCFVISLRILTFSNLYFVNAFVMPQYAWEVREKLSFLTFTIAVLLFIRLMRSLFPVEFPKRLHRLLAFTFAVFSAVILCTSSRIFSYMLTTIQLVMLLALLQGVYTIVLAVWRRRESSRS